MQDLYVFQSTIESKDIKSSPWKTGLKILSSWITRTMSDMTISSQDLLTSADMGRVPSRNGGQKSASWNFIEHSHGRMVRVDVWDYLNGGDQALRTRTTFGTRKNGEYVLRVVVSRESLKRSLSPLRKADVRQPGLIRNFTEAKNLRCIVGLEILTSKYKNIRLHHEVEELIEYINTPQRLPIVIIHTNTLESMNSAKSASTKLVGLARVFTVNYRSKVEIERAAPTFSPRRSSAVLIWPDINVSPDHFGSDIVNSSDSDSLRSRLMERLSLVSVMRRGYDEVFSSVQEAARKEREALEESERSDLLISSNKDDLITSLENSLALSKENENTWREIAESFESDLEGMQGSQAELTSLQRENESLQEQINYLQQQFQDLEFGSKSENTDAEGCTEEDQWSEIPTLRSGDAKSMERLINELEDRSMGRLVFTKRVSKEWKKAKYPFPEDMDKAITSMARLAVDYWENEISFHGNWKDVFMDQYGINFAQFDKAISSDSNLSDFIYDSKVYDRTPHLKLRDNTSPDRCGRIYFAIDDENGRFIVDHVGTKIHTVGIRS